MASPVAFPLLASLEIINAANDKSDSELPPNGIILSNSILSLVSVPVLSTHSRSSSAIASIAANFCGKTFTCANFMLPKANSSELASSNPSGTTVTAAETIVLSIVTGS